MPWLIEPLYTEGSPLNAPLFLLGAAGPLVEMALAILLLFPKTRRAGAVLGMLMHLFILTALGPFGRGWNTSVWPWNVAMMIFLYLLFWRDQETPARAIIVPRRFLHAVVVVLFGICPIGSFFGMWNGYLSAALYSSNIAYAEMSGSPEALAALPPSAQKSLAKHGVFRLHVWSVEEINAPLFPSERVLKNTGLSLCNPGLTVTIFSPPPLRSLEREQEIIPCEGRTG